MCSKRVMDVCVALKRGVAVEACANRKIASPLSNYNAFSFSQSKKKDFRCRKWGATGCAQTAVPNRSECTLGKLISHSVYLCTIYTYQNSSFCSLSQLTCSIYVFGKNTCLFELGWSVIRDSSKKTTLRSTYSNAYIHMLNLSTLFLWKSFESKGSRSHTYAMQSHNFKLGTSKFDILSSDTRSYMGTKRALKRFGTFRFLFTTFIYPSSVGQIC